MSATNFEIVKAALTARTTNDAESVQQLIGKAIGASYQRPVGDRWNNQGMLTASGSSYDHKLLEVVTNMHDAVIERLAFQAHRTLAAIPFRSPHEAATALLTKLDVKQQAALASVTLESCGVGTDKKRVTAVLRDAGCGMSNTAVPRTIFQVGAGHKDGIDWLQGNFGLGGATTFRNAETVVLVTRRHPDLLEPDEDDRITVAVVQWGRQRTTVNAFYLVTKPWLEAGDDSPPFSVPASEYPDFEPGTHLALVAYGTEGLARRSGDERSFDTVFNTRLFRPVMPVSYRNTLVREERVETLDGLERRLDDNPGEPGSEGSDTLPFSQGGRTYHLPVRFRIFAKPGQRGERRNFVAYGHALAITSNGQVHSHWSPSNFKLRTKLNKLYDRILVIVESDAVPIEIRTTLFTADRSQLVQTDAAIRLEKEIAAFLDEWPQLRDANNALIREAISGDNNDRPTIDIARRIARALKVKGFSISGGGSGPGGGTKPPDPIAAEELHDDPTYFKGPEVAEAVTGKAKGVFFKLNAKDDFLGPDKRAQLHVICGHPDIGADEITVGKLRSGRVRVSIAVPDTADLGVFKLVAVIPEWSKSSGGLGPRFEWTTKLELVDEMKPRSKGGKGAGKGKGDNGANQGDLVALIWKSDDEVDDWDASTVGTIEMVPGADLAATRDEYKDLAAVDAEVPTIVLNRTYSPLKSYTQARAAELTDEGKEQARERYAVGVGVALLILDEQQRKDQKSGKMTDEATLLAGRRAAARAVLSVLPEYDRLAKEMDD